MLDVTKLKHLGTGRNRAVYLLPGGRNVIKVPVNSAGVSDNYYEASTRYYLDPWDKKEKCYARCRIIPGTNLLVMQFLNLNFVFDRNLIPKWACYIDCGQVGLDRKGRFKAYDFGIM